MIDISSHILMNMEDGPQSLEQSMIMAKSYSSQSIRHIIATPSFRSEHYMPTMQRHMNLDRLNLEIKRYGLDITVYMGNLIPLDENVVDYIMSGKVITLNSSRYVLVELPMMSPVGNMSRMIYNLKIKGYVPIIAHVERYQYVQSDVDYLLELKDRGVLLQMDYRSLIKKDNSPLSECARELIEREMIDVMATGALDPFDYTPECVEEEQILKDLVGPEYYHLIVHENPRKILENETIIATKPKEKPRKTGFFARFRKKR